MKLKILKQASLPDQLTAELNSLYEVYEYEALTREELAVWLNNSLL